MNQSKYFVLLTILYLLLNYLYYDVNSLVNYMWKLNLNFSYKYAFINYSMILCLGYISLRNEQWANVFFQIITIGIFMPVAIISNHISMGIEMCLLIFFSILLTSMIYRSLIQRYGKFTFSNAGKQLLSVYNFNYLMVFLSVLIVIELILSSKNSMFSGSIMNTFANIYDIRAENRLGGLSSYILGIYFSIFVPLLIATFFYNRSKIVLAFTIFSILILFELYAQKVHFFSLLLLMFFAFSFRYYTKYLNYFVIIFYLIICLITMIGGILIYPFTDRFVYLPGLLNIDYYAFFSTHSYNYFHGSKLGIILNQPGYDIPNGYVIDNFFFGGGMNANTGYIASIYAEIGIVGIFFASAMLAIIMYFINQLFKKYPMFAFLVAVNTAFLLINTPLTNTFLSNGLLLVFFIPLLLKKKKKQLI